MRRSHRRGPAAALAVVTCVFVLLVGVHPISDRVVEHAELVCAAAVLVLGFALALGGIEPGPVPRPPLRGATPVRPADPQRPALVFNETRNLPLRR